MRKRKTCKIQTSRDECSLPTFSTLSYDGVEGVSVFSRLLFRLDLTGSTSSRLSSILHTCESSWLRSPRRASSNVHADVEKDEL